jgi:hypothetical protein
MGGILGDIPQQEALAALAQNLGPRAETLTPVDMWLDGPERLRVLIRVNTSTSAAPQIWLVDLPVEPDEWQELATHLPTFRVIYRALIEEWWDTRAGDASSAGMGRRLF